MDDVIVIGGGIVGQAAAYHFVSAGWQTLLIDNQMTGRSTFAGAGVLSAETNVGASDEWLKIAFESRKYYLELDTTLQRELQISTGFLPCSQLAVAFTSEEFEKLHALRASIDKRYQHCNLAMPYIEEVTVREAQKLCPILGQIAGALQYRNAARVDGERFRLALQTAAQAKGLKVHSGTADGFISRDAHVEAVCIDGVQLRAKHFVIAAGAWTHKLCALLGADVPVEPVKGQILHFGLQDHSTLTWPIVSDLHGYYMIGAESHRLIFGATLDPNAGFDTTIHEEDTNKLLQAAQRFAPSLHAETIIEIRVGLRPFSALDGSPLLLGRLTTAENVYVATGHGPFGLHLGPYTGKLLASAVVEATIDQLPPLEDLRSE